MPRVCTTQQNAVSDATGETELRKGLHAVKSNAFRRVEFVATRELRIQDYNGMTYFEAT